MEAPNINKYFEIVGGDSKEGLVEAHRVIKTLTEFNEDWKKYIEEQCERAYYEGVSSSMRHEEEVY